MNSAEDEAPGVWARMEPILKERGITKRSLATAMGVSSTAVMKLPRGGNLSAANAVRVADILKVSPIWLITGQGARDAEEALGVLLTPQRAAMTLWRAASAHSLARRRAVLAYVEELLAAPDEEKAHRIAGLLDAALASPEQP